MKKSLLCLIISMGMMFGVVAQTTPQGMKYQAVARTLKGDIMVKEKIFLRINLASQQNGISNIHYSEVHELLTSEIGLFSLVIGEGKTEAGKFAAVPWSTNDIWMEVAIGEKGKNSFATISNSKLLAVPYAFHAITASQLVGNGSSVNQNMPGVPAQVWSLKGNSDSDPTTDKLGVTDYVDLIMITNNLERLRITKDGDINIANSLDVGVNLHVGNDATIDNDLTVKQDVLLNTLGGSTINNGPFTVANASSSNLTGTLTVDQNTWLKSKLRVDDITDLNSSLNVNNESPTYLTGIVTVEKDSWLKSKLRVDGITDLNSALNVNNMSATTLTGALNVGGATTLNGTLAANGQVTINADVNGDQGNKGSYPLRVQGSNQGIAITVDGNGENSKNFVTFWDNSGVKGRIEGQTYNELTTSFDFVWANVIGAFDIALPTAEAIACGLNVPPDAAEIVSNTAAAVLAAANVAEYNISTLTNYGVAYESGSGDYAEWLERRDLSDRFAFGDIVGVKGGKISKKTGDADHYMVISMAPIVLGNMPEASKAKNYEKVAFMGQVPVKIAGKVSIGDYILPSGRNDGFGYAVNPDDMKIEDYKKIVGVAWSEAKTERSITYVNVAIGINSNDLSSKMVKQQEELASVKGQLQEIMSYLKKQDPGFKLNSSTVPDAVVAKVPPAAATKMAASPYMSLLDKIESNPELLRQALKVTREMFARSGQDINKNPELARLLTDEAYFLEVYKARHSQ